MIDLVKESVYLQNRFSICYKLMIYKSSSSFLNASKLTL